MQKMQNVHGADDLSAAGGRVLTSAQHCEQYQPKQAAETEGLLIQIPWQAHTSYVWPQPAPTKQVVTAKAGQPVCSATAARPLPSRILIMSQAYAQHP